ncbi:MAG: DUF115 domain-containing protein [Lachnospiraceae bacterium]|nr:DUF115 domain-containing protein [Lachnospiraceae bacterium]
MRDQLKNVKIIYVPIHYIKRCFVWIWCGFGRIVSKLFRKKRSDIAGFKNLYPGRRCFIIATGPSLRLEDLELLKNEITFSMNSIINLYDKTSFRPTFYMLQDGRVEKRFREKLADMGSSKVFIGAGNTYGFDVNISPKTVRRFHPNCYMYYLDTAYHFYNMCYRKPKADIQFSEDCSGAIKDGYTVTYSALQLAVYMGFREIYLLGCDANYAGHVDEKTDGGENKPLHMHIKAYAAAKEYADSHNVKIYNATRGGMLELFPRVSLDDLVP